VNQKSGVSARLSVANYETALASARRRALMAGEDRSVVRLTDLGMLFSSSSGKIELDPYRDETVTEYQVVMKLIDLAIKEVFEEHFPDERYAKQFEEITKQVYQAGSIEISDAMPAESYRELLKLIPGCFDLLRDQRWDADPQLSAAGIEFILEGLTTKEKISRRRLGEISSYKSVDLY
jgi:magnesium chelatase subunit I